MRSAAPTPNKAPQARSGEPSSCSLSVQGKEGVETIGAASQLSPLVSTKLFTLLILIF